MLLHARTGGVYFFFPFRGGYSLTHNLVRALYFPMLWMLLPAGWRVIMRLPGHLPTIGRLLVLYVLASALFHSMLYVDYDWRYQLPSMLALWLVAGFSFMRPAVSRTARAAPAHADVLRP